MKSRTEPKKAREGEIWGHLNLNGSPVHRASVLIQNGMNRENKSAMERKKGDT